MTQLSTKYSGFTIVELLIVIVVIAILATISVVAYNGIQSRANDSRVTADLTSLKKAIQLARIQESKTTYQITGNGCSRCSCPYTNGDTTDYSTLPKTHGCWTAYNATLTKIEQASGVSLAGLRDGDPWKAPYAIDENESYPTQYCVLDTLFSYGSSKNMNGGTITPSPVITVPLSGYTTC